MSRPLACLFVLVALGGCKCDSKYQPEKLSSDAAAIFSRADLPGPGGSLVVDFEQLRVLGLIKPSDGKAGAASADLLMYLLPGVATELKDQPMGPLVARAAVLVGILRDWAPWPHAERFGLLVPAPMPGQGLDSLVDGTTVVLAVKGDKNTNQELLRGLAAMDRAGGAPVLKAENGDLCLSNPALPTAVCLRAGDGFIAVSSAVGLKTLMPGAGSPPPPAAAPALVRLRVEIPLVGKGELEIAGAAAVRVAAKVQAADPQMAAQLEKMANEYLARLDQNRADTRAVMAPALQQTQTALAADAEAPPAMRKVAGQLTLDSLLDSGGAYAQLRQSIHVSRKDADFSVEATFPEPAVRRVRDDSSLLVSVAVVGVFAAVAVPNFTRYQCRSRQAEAKVNLGAINVGERSFQAENGRAATTFDELAFKPSEPTAYTYCVAAGCLDCTTPGCPRLEGDDNPCLVRLQALQEEGDAAFFACAVGNPEGGTDHLDVWFLDESGEVVNVVNDCAD